MPSETVGATTATEQLLHQSNVNGTTLKLQFSSIPSCIEAYRNGEFLIVVDNPSRENEGDLIIAARHLTPELTAFMIRHTSGFLCAPLSPERALALDLPPMIPPSSNTDPNRTAYTVSVDAAARGVTTGISAADRALTSNVLGEEGAQADDLRRPGHIIPLIARPGGVRERGGHTEAGWEFSRLAGISPEVAVIGEMVLDGDYDASGKPAISGSDMMRAPDCLEFGRRWGIQCCTIEDLVEYVIDKEGNLEI